MGMADDQLNMGPTTRGQPLGNDVIDDGSGPHASVTSILHQDSIFAKDEIDEWRFETRAQGLPQDKQIVAVGMNLHRNFCATVGTIDPVSRQGARLQVIIHGSCYCCTRERGTKHDR